MKFTILIIALFSVIYTTAQEAPFFESYSWETNPEYTIPESEAGIISLKHVVVSEFYFESEGSFTEAFLEHRVLWLNSNEKIEESNKVYLPYNDASNILVSKARVITKDGTIKELDESKILTAQDEETGRKYKYFAFEGIEKGSFIEYYYAVQQYPEYKGRRIFLQTTYLKKDTEFHLYAPENLIFSSKSYNGLPEMEKDESSETRNHWFVKIDTLEALNDESESAYNAMRGFLIYKLDKNLSNNTVDISSYPIVAQNVYSYFCSEYPKKTENSLQKFIKTATKGAKDEISTIRKLEYYIKSNIYIVENNSEDLKDLDKILKEKVANENGVLKLYMASLRNLGIEYEIVITSNRREVRFDKDFQAHNFISDFLLYFPSIDKYLDPVLLESRFGFPNPDLTDNYGLFIKEVSLGNNKSSVGSIKYIPAIKAEKTTDKMIVDVTFDPVDLSMINVQLDRELSGYYAMNIQPFIHLVKKEDLNEFIEGFAKNLNENITILKKEIHNDNPELFGIEPLQIVVDFESEAFTEKAGNKYLFKLGELIGPQIQLYQEKKRVLPLENAFTRSYFRTINVTIPEGYRIVNLEDININNSYSMDGEEILSFKSFYELKGQMLVITADEHYRKNIIETEIYEDYRTVINSAADFNKVTLVLEPIQ